MSKAKDSYRKLVMDLLDVSCTCEPLFPKLCKDAPVGWVNPQELYKLIMRAEALRSASRKRGKR